MDIPYWEYSFQSVSRYCAKYNIDCIQETEIQDAYKPYALNHHYYERYKYVELLEKYDSVLWLDSDVLIRNNAPNIFEIYKNNQGIGIFHSVVDQHINKSFHVRPMNTGVVMFNKKTYSKGMPLHLWPTSYHDHTPWYKSLDQYSHLTYRWRAAYHEHCDESLLSRLIPIMQIPTFHIDHEWNVLMGDRSVNTTPGWFLHFGMDDAKSNISSAWQHIK